MFASDYLLAAEGVIGAESKAVGRSFGELLADETGAIKIPGTGTRTFTADQSALVDLAKEAQRTGVTRQEADVLRSWANETGLPFRGPETHPGRPIGQFPHMHLGPINHIPVN